MRPFAVLLVVGLAVTTCAPRPARAQLFGDRWSKVVWSVRDETKGEVPPNTLIMDFARVQEIPGWSSRAVVTDTSGGERAVVLSMAVAVDLGGWTWWDDPQASRLIEGDGRFANLTETQCGLDGTASLYPLAVVSNGDKAVCIAVPPQPARMVRFVYDGKARQLRAEFDFGLSPVPEQFKSTADATVMMFDVPGGPWAFRHALARYYELFPDAFRRRVDRAGTWLPFSDPRGVERAEDFGFAFHEMGVDPNAPIGQDMMARAEQLGCGTYPYVEPQTYWQQFRGPDPAKAGYEPRLAQLKEDAASGDTTARSTLVSGIERADGRTDLYLDPIAWTTMAPFGNNADPAVPPDPQTGWLGRGPFELERLATLAGLRGKPNVGIEGVYIDSLEGWGQIINYRKAHWRVSRSPLTFDPATKRVGLWNHWGTYWFAHDLAKELRGSKDKPLYLFANDVFFRYWFSLPFIDVPGREYAWLDKDGNLAPVPDERYLFFRSMSGKRPYLMLMNNNYDRGEMMEPYFQRSLFYAVFPSMFHGHSSLHDVAYFDNPAWYNRDRHLFVKYLPLIRRLDEAGWEPVPHATATPAHVRVERYGSASAGDLAFTVHNPSDQPVDVELGLDAEALGLNEDLRLHEWLSGDAYGGTMVIRFPVKARGYAAWGMKGPAQ